MSLQRSSTRSQRGWLSLVEGGRDGWFGAGGILRKAKQRGSKGKVRGVALIAARWMGRSEAALVTRGARGGGEEEGEEEEGSSSWLTSWLRGRSFSMPSRGLLYVTEHDEGVRWEAQNLSKGAYKVESLADAGEKEGLASFTRFMSAAEGTNSSEGAGGDEGEAAGSLKRKFWKADMEEYSRSCAACLYELLGSTGAESLS